MQTMPNGDSGKWDFLNSRSLYGSQNWLSIIINKEALNNVSCIAKRQADYKKPKYFFHKVPAFHEIS